MAGFGSKQPARIERAGWNVADWCRSAGVGRTTFYKLQGAMRPECVTVGTRRIVRESPKDWLARMAQRQAQEDAA
jgi:hypothetical protein